MPTPRIENGPVAYAASDPLKQVILLQRQWPTLASRIAGGKRVICNALSRQGVPDA